MKMLYMGIFLDEESMAILTEKEQSLARSIKDMHVTFAFMPSDDEVAEFMPFVGKPVSISVNGYGNNGKNSGFSVALPSDGSYLYRGSKQPHITTSLGAEGRAVETGSLAFSAVAPFEIWGTFGICYDDGGNFPRVKR